MHRDLKLAAALAVLLVGSTTAFFFRGNVDPDAGLPQLQDPERLDAEIARREIGPYLGRPEPDTVRQSGVAAGLSPWAKPVFLEGSGAPVVRRTSVTPDPIHIVMEEESELPDTVMVPGGPVLLSPADIMNGGSRLHTVQAGDTLTGLAARYLGSLSRYKELYELNRDQLEGPDDLRIGMKLRLPPETGRSSVGGPGGSTAKANGTESDPSLVVDAPSPVPEAHPSGTDTIEDAAPTSRGEERTGGKLFVPAKRTPFIPRRYRGSAASSAPELAPATRSEESA